VSTSTGDQRTSKVKALKLKVVPSTKTHTLQFQVQMTPSTFQIPFYQWLTYWTATYVSSDFTTRSSISTEDSSISTITITVLTILVPVYKYQIHRSVHKQILVDSLQWKLRMYKKIQVMHTITLKSRKAHNVQLYIFTATLCTNNTSESDNSKERNIPQMTE